MPTGASGIKVLVKVDTEGELHDPISVILRDSTTIQVIYSDLINVVGVYIPFNDPGFRGINGGMINPGELAMRDGAPGAFPWCCAIG
jgi:hypothetical protein